MMKMLCMKTVGHGSLVHFTAIAVIAVELLGCGGASTPSSGSPTPPPVVSISISPTSGSVQVGLTQQFTATISGTTNTTATWQVNGVTGGATSTGTVSSSGLYTAPAAIPSPPTVTVTAISTADTTKSASATVTITPPPVSVSVSPTSASVITLHIQQFTAPVSNTTNTAVSWTVNGVSGGSSTAGTISSAGLYTAPAAVPIPATVTVTATSSADATKSANAQVTVQAPTIPTGTWSSIGPAGITSFSTLAADPANSQTMYVAPSSFGGLYKTTNLGQVWSLLPTAPYLSFSPVVAPTGGTLYAFSRASYQSSADGGKTFSALANYPGNLDSETNGGFTVAIDPKSDQTIYVLTPSSLVRSINGGSTWTTLTAPSSPYLVNNLPYPVTQTLFVSTGNSSTLFCASNSGFAISKDGGATWQFQNTGLDPNFVQLRQIVLDPANPSRLIAFGTYSGASGTSPSSYIYLSTNGGSTWTHVGTFGVLDQLAPNQTGPGIYVVSTSGLYVSFNGGSTWTDIAPSGDPSGYTATVSPVSPLVMAYEGFDDLFVSQDGGATWTVSESGLNARQIGQVASAGSSGALYATLFNPSFFVNGAYSTQMWRSSGPGQSWTSAINAYSGTSLWLFDVDPTNPLHLLGVEQHANSGSTSVVSNDGGSTWTPIPYAAGMDHGFPVSMYSGVHFGAPGSNLGYACGTFGIARLSLTSSTWTIINNGIPSGASCTSMGVDQLMSGTLYAGTSAGVYRSTDGGNNWSLLFSDSGSFVSIIVDPTNSQNVYLSSGGGTLAPSMRSTNAGKAWIQMSVAGQMAINPTNPSNLYAVGQTYLSASYDSGLTWATITSPYNFQQDLVVTPSGVVVISTVGSSVVAFTPK